MATLKSCDVIPKSWVLSMSSQSSHCLIYQKFLLLCFIDYIERKFLIYQKFPLSYLPKVPIVLYRLYWHTNFICSRIYLWSWTHYTWHNVILSRSMTQGQDIRLYWICAHSRQKAAKARSKVEEMYPSYFFFFFIALLSVFSGSSV